MKTDCTARVNRGNKKNTGRCLKPAKVFVSGEKRLCYWHARQEGLLPVLRRPEIVNLPEPGLPCGKFVQVNP